MRRLRQGRRHGQTHPGPSSAPEEGGTEAVGGPDQSYVAYLLERLLYGMMERSNVEFAAYRERLRKEYDS